MRIAATYLPYQQTGFFSEIVQHYQQQTAEIKKLIAFSPDEDGITKAIRARKDFSVDRKALAHAVQKQYEGTPLSEAVFKNIAALERENTFTVCTAHQPNLLTGYLYFVYKIIHAIKLAEELSKLFPQNHFVPVYYMGSEDNDLEELGTFNYEGEKFTWDASGQQGAVGRMHTKSLKLLLDELFKKLGPPGRHRDQLKELIETAYLKHNTIASATRYLVHELFGRFGLIVLDPDDASLKRTFIPVMKDDLLQHRAKTLLNEYKIYSDHYKMQAHPRAINLFYLNDGVRERIEQHGDHWMVVNTEKSWDQNELLTELESHPERFSPNVILRPLYQETILPNIAFIGGGAELAYWLQLKPVFDHYKVFYPAVLLRQSVLWISKKEFELRKKTALSIEDVFQNEEALVKEYVQKHSDKILDLEEEIIALERVFQQMKTKAASVDTTLSSSAEAILTRIKHLTDSLQKKMLRAEKKHMHIETERLRRLKSSLFPEGSLQERKENFISYYPLLGSEFFDIIKQNIHALKNQFLILEEQE